MRHRIFLAINLPEKIKQELSKHQNKIERMFTFEQKPIRWVKKGNLHITMVFLGYVSEEDIPEILKTTEQTVKQNNSFSINLNKICYGPPKKILPRMVWALGEKSEELGKLQTELENSLLSFPKGLKRSEGRPHTPHITLGRIQKWKFKRIEPEERPEIEEDISLSFQVNSIEIMESQLKRTGAEYSILQSFQLK
jgi:2'-5' RNA ligase